MTTKLDGQGDAVPAVQPWATTAAQGTRRTRTGTGPSYLWERGLAARRLARHPRAASSTSSARRRARRRREAQPRRSSSRATTSGTRCCKLEADARAHGAGQTYLVQHSAGSGKSNTIAWLAHRLSTLHDADDQKVFDKVVVITDRVVLDRQLQDTIYQFEHAHGVVVKIDKDSAQLAEALAGEQARIIITTLQKFPFVLDKVGELPGAPLRGRSWTRPTPRRPARRRRT